MTTNPVESLRQNLETLLSTIEDCRTRKRFLPTLVLLYSGMDVVASLERDQSELSGAAFRRWAERYVLRSGDLPCSALDLWAARCGVIHSYTASTDWSRRGKAKEVVYAWGSATTMDLAEIVRVIGHDCVVIHLDTLVASFRRGVSDYLLELAADLPRASALQSRAGLWLTNLDKNTGDKFLRLVHREPEV